MATPPSASPLSAPPDARRAAARARDAVRAAAARSGVPVGSGDGVRVEAAEPEAALPVAGLARALVEAAARPEARLAPGGGWTGAPFPAEEACVTSWELDLLSERRAAGPVRTAPVAGRPPVTVAGRRAEGPAAAFSPWLVHSFAGRKGYARPDVQALIPAAARSVLDVGCGEGALGEALEARGARVTGIELDESAVRIARRRLSRVLALPAEEAIGLLDARPDVVVLADVLEHLARPSAVLRAVRGLLAPGGLVVFSLPNATHASVLGGALRGRWDRELEGVVADDHRTWAGREGWTGLFTTCGFRVTAFHPASARTRVAERDRTALLASTRLSPEELDAVQWLGTAEVAGPGSGEDVRGAPEADGPLGGEDPVGAVAAAGGRVVLEVANAARGGILETLLRGGLLHGRDAAPLSSGWTPLGLSRRFEGSGLRAGVSAIAREPLPPGVNAAVVARRAAGLPVDEDSLASSGWRVTFGSVDA